MEWFKHKIYVDSIVHPRFIPARSVPYALGYKVDKELDRLQEEGILELVEILEWAAPIVPIDRLQEEGILELVEILEWAAPIVPILKQDKQSICICGAF